MPSNPRISKEKKDPCQKILTNLPPLKMDANAISSDFKRYFAHTLGRDDHCTSSHYPYQAMAMALRDRLIERWKNSRRTYVGSRLQTDLLSYHWNSSWDGRSATPC